MYSNNFMTNNNTNHPLVMVIFGASGDLTKRKLMPAIFSLYKEKRLTQSFSILGIGRTVYDDINYRSYILKELKEFLKPEEQNNSLLETFVSDLHYLSMDPSVESDYSLLLKRLQELSGVEKPDNILYYLATPPLFMV